MSNKTQMNDNLAMREDFFFFFFFNSILEIFVLNFIFLKKLLKFKTDILLFYLKMIFF